MGSLGRICNFVCSLEFDFCIERGDSKRMSEILADCCVYHYFFRNNLLQNIQQPLPQFGLQSPPALDLPNNPPNISTVPPPLQQQQHHRVVAPQHVVGNSSLHQVYTGTIDLRVRSLAPAPLNVNTYF